MTEQPHVEIYEDDQLYRRLLPKDHVALDGETVLPTAFMRRWKPDPSVSVDLARLTTPEETVQRAPSPGFGVGVLEAGVPMRLGLTVRHDPLSENYAQTLIEGVATREHCRRLADATRIVIQPQPPPTPD